MGLVRFRIQYSSTPTFRHSNHCNFGGHHAENGFFKNRGVPVKVAKLTKAYETSAEEVRALKGVDWEIVRARRLH